MYMIGSAVSGGYTVLALIMALNSAIAAYYYLKLIVFMFMKEPVYQTDKAIHMVNASMPLKSIIGFATVVTIFSVLIVSPLMEFITALVYNSGY